MHYSNRVAVKLPTKAGRPSLLGTQAAISIWLKQLSGNYDTGSIKGEFKVKVEYLIGMVWLGNIDQHSDETGSYNKIVQGFPRLVKDFKSILRFVI